MSSVLHQDTDVRVDILAPLPEGSWQIIAVKSAAQKPTIPTFLELAKTRQASWQEHSEFDTSVQGLVSNAETIAAEPLSGRNFCTSQPPHFGAA